MDPPKGRLPGWARVLPHYLKPLGYRCYHSGKWHLSGAPRAVADGGFDRSYKLDDQDRFLSGGFPCWIVNAFVNHYVRASEREVRYPP